MAAFLVLSGFGGEEKLKLRPLTFDAPPLYLILCLCCSVDA